MDVTGSRLVIASIDHAHTADDVSITTNIRYWVNASTDGLWHNPANWATISGGPGGAGVPTDEDEVHFNSANTTNCLVGSAVSFKSLDVSAGYTGTLNFNGQTVYCGEDFILSSGTVRLGYGNTINVGGNVTTNPTTLYPETSTFYLTGTSKTFTASSLKPVYSIIVAPGAAYSLPVGILQGNLTVNGSLDISSSVTVYRTVSLGASGSLTGAGTLSITSSDGLASNSLGGTWDVSTTALLPLLAGMPSISAGTYGSATFNISNTTASPITIRPQGDIKFSGNVAFYRTGGAALTVDCATNNPTFTFAKNLDVYFGVTWVKGTGTLLFSGTANQTASFTTHEYEAIHVNKTTGRVRLLSDVTTTSFTGDDGDFDLDGFVVTSLGTVDINGGLNKFRFHNGTDYAMDNSSGTRGKFIALDDITLSGDASQLLRISKLDFAFDLPVTATATYCYVEYSTATGTGIPVDAEDGTNTDKGSNVGWDFNRDLVVSSTTHAHSADNSNVSAYANLEISSSGHIQAVDSVSVNSNVGLVIEEISHAQTADALNLTAVFTLVTVSSDHAQTADSLYLASTGELGVLPGDHTNVSDNPALVTFATVLETENSQHSQTADEPTLQVVYGLVIESGDHTLTSEAADVLLRIAGLDSGHAISSTQPTLDTILTLSGLDSLLSNVASRPILDVTTTPVGPDDDQSNTDCTIICGPVCEWIFARLRAWPLINGGTRVEWTLHPQFGDPEPHVFQLQFGRTGNPLADDWTDVGLPVVNTYWAVDDEKRVFGTTQWTHYRVVVTTAQRTFASKPTPLFGSLPKRQWRIAKEIERLELLRLRKEAGQEGYLLKRRLFGTPCTCLDGQTEEVANPQCETCYGTGFVSGYYDPYPCFYAELGLSGTNNRLDGGQSRGTVDDANRTWARMLNSPQIFSHDVWVDRDTDNRWEIHGISNIAEVNGVPVVVKAELRRLPYSHAIYGLEIDDQIPN
jgi:hypothetical protein